MLAKWRGQSWVSPRIVTFVGNSFFPKNGTYPDQLAKEALGHNSKAVHRAHAKLALMKIPSLEDYEQRAAAKVEPMD